MLSQSLGIETKGGVFTALIGSGTPVPARSAEIFTTADRNQAHIQISLFQGNNAMAADNNRLGKFVLSGIGPARPGVPQIEVAFDVDVTGLVTVSARDLGSGNALPVTRSEGPA